MKSMSDKQRATLAAEGHLYPSSTVRRGGRISRKTKPKARNVKRRQSEFARCYGSRQRVEWVKSLPCMGCVTYWPISPSPGWLSENAHTVTGGAGRKADADTIIPLCTNHHRRYDRHLAPFDHPEVREQMRYLAKHVDDAWQAQWAASGRDDGRGSGA